MPSWSQKGQYSVKIKKHWSMCSCTLGMQQMADDNFRTNQSPPTVTSCFGAGLFQDVKMLADFHFFSKKIPQKHTIWQYLWSKVWTKNGGKVDLRFGVHFWYHSCFSLHFVAEHIEAPQFPTRSRETPTIQLQEAVRWKVWALWKGECSEFLHFSSDNQKTSGIGNSSR